MSPVHLEGLSPQFKGPLSMTTPLIWLVGSPEAPCFAPAIDWLATQATLLRIHDTLKLPSTVKDSGRLPHGIVFCALRAGELEADTVETFHRVAPFARLALLLGAWCEGEVRSGRVIPGIKRIYWHQWRGMLPGALGLHHGDEPREQLPRTASDGEWLEALVGRATHDVGGKVVAVCTARAATYDTLADALASGGFQTMWQLPHLPVQTQGADVWLWDGWPVDEHSAVVAQAHLPQLLLLDFPRPEDRERALHLGMVEIISRPFHLSELWQAIGAAIQKSSLSVS